MSVGSEIVKQTFLGNDVAVDFDFSVMIIENTDLKVIKIDENVDPITETELTLGVDYTISINEDRTGTLTASTAPLTGEKIFIKRDMPLTSDLNIPPDGKFPEKTVQVAIDKVTLQLQQVNEETTRALKMAETKAGIQSIPSQEAGKALKWGEEEGELVNSTYDIDMVVADLEETIEDLTTQVVTATNAATSAANSATSATTSASNASASETNAGNSAIASATSATSASNAQTAAEAAQTAAEAARDAVGDASTIEVDTSGNQTETNVQAALEDLKDQIDAKASDVSDASDVDTTGRADGQVLYWDEAESTHKYKNGGSVQNTESLLASQTDTDITGFIYDPADFHSVEFSYFIKTATKLEKSKYTFISNGTAYTRYQSSIAGVDSGIELNLSATGQLQYSSSTETATLIFEESLIEV